MNSITSKIDAVGFFTMADVKEVEKMNNISAAKAYAHAKIESMPNAQLKNIEKAHKMVDKTRSIKDLMFAMVGFIMAHPSENMKVIR